MKKIIVFLIVLVVLTCSAAAETPEPSEFSLPEKATGEGRLICEFLLANTDAQGAAMPKGVPFKNERFEAYTLEGELIGFMIVQDGIITHFSCQELPAKNPTIKVTVKDQDTVLGIFRAQDPLAAWNSARSAGHVNLEGQGFGKSVKVGAVKIAARVAGWFT